MTESGCRSVFATAKCEPEVQRSPLPQISFEIYYSILTAGFISMDRPPIRLPFETLTECTLRRRCNAAEIKRVRWVGAEV